MYAILFAQTLCVAAYKDERAGLLAGSALPDLLDRCTLCLNGCLSLEMCFNLSSLLRRFTIIFFEFWSKLQNLNRNRNLCDADSQSALVSRVPHCADRYSLMKSGVNKFF